jgi:hypothetical protein
MELLNCTPHAITVCDTRGTVLLVIPPSGFVARAPMLSQDIGSVSGVPIAETRAGKTEGLPEKQSGYACIVSMTAYNGAPERDDLLVPHGTVKDGDRIIGCTGFARPVRTGEPCRHDLPALACDIRGLLRKQSAEWTVTVSRDRMIENTCPAWPTYREAPITIECRMYGKAYRTSGMLRQDEWGVSRYTPDTANYGGLPVDVAGTILYASCSGPINLW